MPSCSINGCRKTSRNSKLLKDGITFHRFPQCPIKRTIWAAATGRHRSWIPGKYNYICSSHFAPDFFARSNRRRLKTHAVPTLLLPFHITPQLSPSVYETHVVKEEIDTDVANDPNKTLADLSLKVDTQAKHIECLHALNIQLRREVARLKQEGESPKCNCEKEKVDREKEEREHYVVIDDSDEDDPLCII